MHPNQIHAMNCALNQIDTLKLTLSSLLRSVEQSTYKGYYSGLLDPMIPPGMTKYPNGQIGPMPYFLRSDFLGPVYPSYNPVAPKFKSDHENPFVHIVAFLTKRRENQGDYMELLKKIEKDWSGKVENGEIKLPTPYLNEELNPMKISEQTVLEVLRMVFENPNEQSQEVKKKLREYGFKPTEVNYGPSNEFHRPLDFLPWQHDSVNSMFFNDKRRDKRSEVKPDDLKVLPKVLYKTHNLRWIEIDTSNLRVIEAKPEHYRTKDNIGTFLRRERSNTIAGAFILIDGTNDVIPFEYGINARPGTFDRPGTDGKFEEAIVDAEKKKAELLIAFEKAKIPRNTAMVTINILEKMRALTIDDLKSINFERFNFPNFSAGRVEQIRKVCEAN